MLSADVLKYNLCSPDVLGCAFMMWSTKKQSIQLLISV